MLYKPLSFWRVERWVLKNEVTAQERTKVVVENKIIPDCIVTLKCMGFGGAQLGKVPVPAAMHSEHASRN